MIFLTKTLTYIKIFLKNNLNVIVLTKSVLKLSPLFLGSIHESFQFKSLHTDLQNSMKHYKLQLFFDKMKRYNYVVMIVLL
jgi:hypothetical protein